MPTPPPPQVGWHLYSQMELSLQVHSPVLQDRGLLMLPQSQAVVQLPPVVDAPPPQPNSDSAARKKKVRTASAFSAKRPLWAP